MTDKAWKKAERKAAALFATERAPLSGSNGKVTESDSLHPRLFIETKYRKAWSILTLWRSILKKARKEKKIPVIAIREKGKHGQWLLIHSDDLKAIAKELVE